ncbi:GDSL-type esterase/lipase family protein [Mesobacillus foraminis]
MKKKILSKAIGVLLLVMVLMTGLAGSPAHAEPSNYKFDFGNGDVEQGYIGVSAGDKYNKKTRYGFNTPENMADVPASGEGETSDAVQFLKFGTKSDNTFNVDLPEGLYEVKVTLGNTARASIAAEGVYQVMNMTGNGATDTFQIPVTDGQLNLLVTEGKVGTNFTLSALEINKLSRHPETNRTIYIGGDSTVCNYYPLDSSVQTGWGQLLPEFVDTEEFQVRNMATGGQFARGFRDDGQLEAILKYIKPGDYFILQFGINDTAAKNNTTEEQFKEIMRDMVHQVEAKGATVILSTPQGKAMDFNEEGIHTSVDRWYRHSIIAVAKEENVPLVDLNLLSSAYFTSIGQEATIQHYMPDTLHLNRKGGTELARIVAEELERQGFDGFVEEEEKDVD